MVQIKLLVVDDSLLMQKVLTDIFKTDKEISVIGTARNGEEALLKIASLHPDVVTMDIEMPKMDGLTAVRNIMETNPVPVVMLSALTQNEAQLTSKALEFGAIDYVPKPYGQISLNMDIVKNEMISKIKTASHANLSLTTSNFYDPLNLSKTNEKIISIAASTGGPNAISKILRTLPSYVPPILIVQHMPKVITKHFAEGLNDSCKFTVKEAQEGDKVQECLALIAPGGFHMIVTKEDKIHLTLDPPVNYVRPAADVLMGSLAEKYGSKNVGVVLTGMGADGAQGIRAIKEKGGITIAQDEKTSIVFGMPSVAFQTGCVDSVAPLELIPKEIMKACS
jgi:two-component system chemotaxis response regulator CheB